MKKYRKISAFIIALTLCISMAACGSTDSSDNTAAANTTTTVSEKSEEPSEVSEAENDKQEPDSDRPGEPPEGTSCLRLWSPEQAREFARHYTKEAAANLVDIPGTQASAALSDMAEQLLVRVV